MSLIRTALLAGGMSLALATSAFAQSGGANEGFDVSTIEEGTGVMLGGMSGASKPVKMKIGKKGHAMLTSNKHAIELPARTMIYKKNGRYFIVTDKKMPDNTMLFDKAKDWEADE